MRFLWIVTLGALVCTGASAQDGTAYRDLAPRYASQVYNGPRGTVSGWIWSERYTYSPGDTLTLRQTLKTNNDLYPYTVFLYEQNNQTGKKTYFPGGVETPTDIDGNTAAQGYQPRTLTDATKTVLIGSGGKFPAWIVPSEPGMHTFVFQLRDYTGTRVLKAWYMKIGVVTSTQTISGNITTSRTLTNDTQWNLQGTIFVKDGAVLTIEPGTFIFGLPGAQPNVAALIIARTATIEAHGTAARPIIFTSTLAFGQRSRGNWGGLVLLGRAPVNLAAGAQFSNPNAGEGYIEGLQTTADALYGGGASPDATHYCGTLQYVRVEYAGIELTPANELNSFTFGGCGTKTVVDHIESLFGGDDHFEWFGGNMYAKYLVGGLGADDCLDYQLGYTGKAQFAICYQSPNANGARGVEGDNSQFNELAVPFSDPTWYNATFIGLNASGTEDNPTNGIHLRRGTRGSFYNFVINQWRGSAIKLNDANTLAQANNGFVKLNGMLLWKGALSGTPADTLAGNILAADATTLTFLQGSPVGGAQNIVVADPLLTRPFEFSDPDFSALFGSPVFRAGAVQPPDDGFFDQSARFLGGIGDVNWTEEWTNFLVDSDIN